ncbi:MAG: hypothetical protein JEY79_07255 [Pseudodesulfovibrio sp.]|nr:hypothetical protein [Pseudodesulfovibrio sp.]
MTKDGKDLSPQSVINMNNPSFEDTPREVQEMIDMLTKLDISPTDYRIDPKTGDIEFNFEAPCASDGMKQ